MLSQLAMMEDIALGILSDLWLLSETDVEAGTLAECSSGSRGACGAEGVPTDRLLPPDRLEAVTSLVWGMRGGTAGG